MESSQTRDQTDVPALAGRFLSTAWLWSLDLPNWFSKQLWHFTFLPSVYKALISLHSHKTLVIICLFFNYSHSSEGELVSHCGFDCISLMANDIEHLFILSVCRLWRNFSLDPLFIFNWVFIFYWILIIFYMELPWWLSDKESTCQCRKCGFDSWVRKIPWSRKWQPTPVLLPGNSHG